LALGNLLVDRGDSPLEMISQQQLKERVERELRQIDEPFRTTIILREIEELSYEEIAEVTDTSLGTVKSRLTRGREALKKRLQPHLRELGQESARPEFRPPAGQKVEAMS
jgi:RNA polymerase sigma-70 factor, ECF subfamily